MKSSEYDEVARKYAAAALEQVIADLKSGKLQSQLVDSSAKIYALLREIMPTKSALRELTPYANKAVNMPRSPGIRRGGPGADDR